MKCTQFKKLYEKYWNLGPVNNQYSSEHANWNKHKYECNPCFDWSRTQYCIYRGIDPDNHCCLDMAYAISHPIETIHQGTNRILDWEAITDEYLIPIPYDGYKATIISYCPFCGKILPESKRDLWYKTLHELGYDDPGKQNIPPDFRSDKWWRNRNT
jgi:hypothetical protein